jgi:hypothetical protein
MIEYAVQADIPDYVFDHPTIIAMSEATTDILTWPNVRSPTLMIHCYLHLAQDLISFNVSSLSKYFIVHG